MAIVHCFLGECKDYVKGIRVKVIWGLPQRCPCHCGGHLVKWGGYRRKTCVAWVQRMRCKSCGKTQAILPHFLAPYQRELTEVRENLVKLWMDGPVSGVWLMGSVSV